MSPCIQGNRRTIMYIFTLFIIISHCAWSVPSAAPLRSCLRVFGERPVTSAGGARPRPAYHPPGRGPPPRLPRVPSQTSTTIFIVCTLSHARAIWALHSLLDGEPSQPSTGIRSIPDHFSRIGWPRLVPSLKPGDFKHPGSLLRQHVLA